MYKLISKMSVKFPIESNISLRFIYFIWRRRKNGRKNKKNRKRGNTNSDLNDEYGKERNDLSNFDKHDSSSSFHRDTSYINSGIIQKKSSICISSIFYAMNVIASIFFHFREHFILSAITNSPRTNWSSLVLNLVQWLLIIGLKR